MIVLMSATTFLTQKQLMSKNMPADAMNNPFAQQQKILLYVFPLVFAVSGVNFPIGVLLYWLTTNLWSMGQQFYVIRRNPSPGLAGLRGAGATAGGQGGQAPAPAAARHPARPAAGGRRRRRRRRLAQRDRPGGRRRPGRQARPGSGSSRSRPKKKK